MMPKVEVKKVIRVPRERAVEYFGDTETYFKVHSGKGASYEMISRDGQEVVVVEKRKLARHEIQSTHKIVFRLPQRIDSKIIAGDGEGSTQRITFESVPEGTRVVYVSDLELGGGVGRALRKLGKKLIKKLMKDTAEEEAEKDRKYLEGDKGDEGYEDEGEEADEGEEED
jgi:carbon monoxide dehydrogenase subunit G